MAKARAIRRKLRVRGTMGHSTDQVLRSILADVLGLKRRQVTLGRATVTVTSRLRCSVDALHGAAMTLALVGVTLLFLWSGQRETFSCGSWCSAPFSALPA